MRTETGRKSGEVYRLLKQRIIMSHLLQGCQLIELELAGELGCSQSTVREALLRLQEDGLVVRQGYKGSSVTVISPAEAEACLDVRTRLETRAARKALANLQPENLVALETIITEMTEAAQQNEAYQVFEKDQEFHMYLFQIAKLPALTPVLARCSVYSHRTKIAQSQRPRTLTETAERHWSIVAALRKGDADELEEIIHHHVQSVFGQGRAAIARAIGPAQMTDVMASIQARLLQEDGHLPDITALPIEAARAQFIQCHERWNRFDESLFCIEKFVIPANPLTTQITGPMAAVRITPKGAAPIGNILYLHGGGWVFGGIATHHATMARLAAEAGCAVVGIDYPLAPEAPFPQGLNGCAWAWRWLRMQQDSDMPWAVAGDSSGANLALAMMLDLRNLGEVLPDVGALFYGNYAMDYSTESHRLLGQGGFGLTSKKMAWYGDQYLAGSQKDALSPRVSPLLATLNGLPPLFVGAAGLDPLRDDSTRLVQRLADCGAGFEFKLYEGVLHGFMQMSSELPEAMEAFKDAATFLRARFMPKQRGNS